MAFALTVSANETKPEGTKKQVKIKKEKTQLKNTLRRVDGRWNVSYPSPDEMDCDAGGDSNCPIFEFLQK